jgi:hypothetical protein
MRFSLHRVAGTAVAITLFAAIAMTASFTWLALPGHDACGARTLATRLYRDAFPHRPGRSLTREDYELLRVTLGDLLEHVKRDVPPASEPATVLIGWPFREDGSDIGGEIVVNAYLETSLPAYPAVSLDNCYWTGCSDERGDLAERLSQYDAMRGLLLDVSELSAPRTRVRDLSGIPRGDESILHWDQAQSRDPQAVAYISLNPPAIAADGINAAVIGRVLFQPHPAYFEITLSRTCSGWQVLRRNFMYSF